MKSARYLFILGICLGFINFVKAQNFSLEFDGASTNLQDWVDIPTLSGPGSAAPFTLEAWVKVRSTGGVRRTILEFANDAPYFGLNTSGDFQITGTTPTASVPLNTWTHLAATFDGTTLTLVVDGVAQGSQTVQPPNTGSSAGIGYHLGDNGFDGWIDEVRVWDIHRDASTINAAKDSELSGTEPGLRAYYNFNEGTGTILGDLAGTAETGTLQNGDNTTPADGSINGPLWSTDVPFNYALSFDGLDDYVGAGTTLANNIATTFTVEAWIYPESIDGANGNVIYNKWQSGLEDKLLNITGGGNINFSLFGAGGVTSAQTVPLSTWTHVAGVYDGSNMTIYINGQQDGQTAATGDVADGVGTNYIGGNFDRPDIEGEYFDGQIDEVRIWSAVRSIDAINAYNNFEVTGTENGLLAYYDMSVNTTLTDQAGANNGSIVGAVQVAATQSFNAFTSAAEISVFGNGLEILSGDFSPSTTDFTSFGDIPVGQTSTRTYSVVNQGTTPLNVSNLVPPSGFVVTSATSFSVNPGESVEITVDYTAATLGSNFGTFTITNDDGDEGSYTFDLFATGANFSLDFDGTDDIVVIADNAIMQPAGDFTIEAWINPADISTYQRIVAKFDGNDAGTDNGSIVFDTYDGVNGAGLRAVVTNSSDVNVPTPATGAILTQGIWQHVAMVFEQGVMTTYLNGAAQTSVDVGETSLVDNSNSWSIGEDFANGFNEVFNGQIDEVRFWHSARTPDQLVAFRDVELTGTEAGLVAYYPMNLEGGLLDDRVGENAGIPYDTNDGTFTGAVLVTNAPSINLLSTSREIGLFGNGNEILSGDVTPDATDNTDFGLVARGGSASRTFTIANVGQTTLSISDIQLSGADYSVGFAPGAPAPYDFTIPAGGTEEFDINIDPTLVSTRLGTVTVQSNDGNEGTYTFDLSTNAQNVALDFDGTNDFVDLGSGLRTLFTSTTDITVEAWVYRETTQSFHTIVGNYASGLQTLLRLDNSQLTFWVHNGTSFTQATSAGSIPLTTWTHVAGTWDGTTIRVYINGVEDGSTTHVGTFTDIGGDYNIGGDFINFPSELMNGQIDEVRIWNIVRDATTINAEKDNELVGDEAGLVAYYNFSDGPGSSVLTDRDATPGQYDGTLQNMDVNADWVAGNAAIAEPCDVPTINSPTITDNSFCGGGDGSISITASTAGGEPSTNYTMTIYEGIGTGGSIADGGSATNSNVTGGTGITANNLIPNDYTIEVINNDTGCLSILSVTVSDVSVAPSINTPGIAVTDESFDGAMDGALDATGTASGTPGPYNYQWYSDGGLTMPVGSGPTVTGLSAGVYYLQATDNTTGCDNVSFVEIFVTPTISNVFNISSTNVFVNVTVPAGSSIELEIDMDPAFGTPLFSQDIGATGGTRNISQAISSNTQYYARARAVFGGGNSEWVETEPFMLRAGNTLDFDGNDDDISLPNTGVFPITANSSSFTIEMWVKGIPGQNENYLFSEWDSGNGLFGFHTGPVNDRFTVFKRTPGNVTQIDQSTTAVVFDNTWHHVAFVQDGTTATVYVDGVMDFQDLSAGGTIALTDVVLGSARSATQFFDGQLDEIRIWNVARNLTDIQNNIGNTLAGDEPGLIAYYRFDQGDANGTNPTETILFDYSGSGRDGTLNANFDLSGFGSNWIPSQALSRAFITTWTTTGASEMITIPTTATGQDYTVDWGDGIVETAFGGDASHTYAVAGTYPVQITGDFPNIYFNNTGDRDKIQTIEQWGDIAWNSFNNAFFGCSNLISNAMDAPDLSGVTDLSFMFYNATSFTGDLSNWDVITINNMSNMFRNAAAFSSDLSSWDVTNVNNMYRMFYDADVFTSDLSGWNVMNVTDMRAMFRNTQLFNSNIGGWNVSNINSTYRMFFGTQAFNQDLSLWDVDQVTDMRETFRDAAAFDQSLGGWTVTAVTDMSQMLDNSALSVANYDATLSGWATQSASLQVGVTLGANGLEYSSAGAVDRATLTGAPSAWTILGDAGVLPTAPSNLVAFSPDGTNITLEWTDSENETSYSVYRSDSYENFSTNDEEITGLGLGPDATSVTFAEDPVKQYYIVDAVNGSGFTSSSIEFATTEAFPGRALSFVSTNSDHVIYSESSALDAATSGTVEAWINTSDASAGFKAVVFLDAIFGLFVDTGILVTWDGSAIETSGTFVADGNWHHVAMTYQHGVTDGSQFYVDGVAVGSPFTHNGFKVASSVLSIGSNGGTTQFWNGLIDEVRIWNTLRNVSELSNNRFNSLQGNENGLIGYFPLDEEIGASTVVDRSENTNDGTITGATFTPSSVPLGPPLNLISSNPIVNANNVLVDANITLTFNANVDAASANASNIIITGSQSGLISAIFSAGGSPEVVIDPDNNFKRGEVVTITFTEGLQGETGEIATPKTLQFYVETQSGPSTFLAENLISETADGVQALALADLDGDGDTDIISASQFDNSLSWYPNDGTGVFGEIEIDNSLFYATVVPNDIDLDGDIDLVVHTTSTVYWYENDGLTTPGFIQNQIGTFNSNFKRDIFPVDIDQDGDVDVLSVSETDDALSWFENDGAQSFTENVISTNAIDPQTVVAGDIDDDGDIDIVTGSQGDDEITLYTNNGGLSFTESLILGVQNPTSLGLADFNGDGNLDIVASGEADANFYVFINNGGSFTPISGSALDIMEVFPADIDGDGDMDVLTASRAGNEIAWFENDGLTTPGFTENVISTTNTQSRNVEAADIDGDGDLDVLATSFDQDQVRLYEQDFEVPIISNAYNVTATDFQFDFIVPAGATDIQVDVATEPTFGSPLTPITNIGTSGTFTFDISIFTTFAANTEYYYRARAVYPSNQSEFVVSNSFMVAPGNALDLDGVDDYLSVASTSQSFPSGSNPFTFETWINRASGETGDRWIAWWGNVTPTTDQEVIIGYDGATGLVKLNRFGVGHDIQATTATLPEGQWAHLAVVYPGTGFTSDIYINGSYIETINNGVPVATPANPVLQLGTFDSNGAFATNAQLDETRIWNVARSAGDIQNGLTTELVGNNTGLVLYYRYDQGTPGAINSESVVLDLTGEGNDASLNNIDQGVVDLNVSNWVTSNAFAFPAYTVVNTLDDGPGSLRRAIDDANLSLAKETIFFNIPGNGPWTITLQSALPTVTNANGMVIDGTTQNGWDFDMGIVPTLVAFSAGSYDALVVNAPNVEVYGLAITNFSDAIQIDADGDAVIIGSPTKPNHLHGNDFRGINIGTGVDGGTIQGNRIGTTADGTAPSGNGRWGVYLSGASNITIGGDSGAGEGNLISGNGGSTYAGIQLAAGNSNINIYGNLIGTDKDGNGDLGNAFSIGITSSSTVNVGSTTLGFGNVIAGAQYNGEIVLAGTPSAVIIQNNIIGLNSAGSVRIETTASSTPGISMGVSATGVEILQNTISGMSGPAITINGAITLDTKVRDNFIGTNSVGTQIGTNLSNDGGGIYISATGVNNTTGRIEVTGNVISGNGGRGLDLQSSTNVYVQNNDVGVETNGTTAYGNSGHGIYMNDATNVEIANNTIAYNGLDGLFFNNRSNLNTGVIIGNNSYFCNVGLGINFDNAATVPPPVITTVNSGEISGTVTPSASGVDIFQTNSSCGDNQGALFIANVGTSSGTWVYNSAINTGESYVAMVNDGVIGISEFSSTFAENALSFNGTSDFVDLGNPASLEITGDLTLEAWINWTGDNTDFRTIVGRAVTGDLQAQNILYILQISTDGRLRYFHEHGPGTDVELYSNSTVPSGQWVHVAVTRSVSASSEIRFYLNGELDAVHTGIVNTDGGSNASQLVWIGGKNQAGLEDYFIGEIDELRVWNTARTHQEIADNAYNTLTTGPTASFSFNHGSGDLIDLVAGNNGTVSGATYVPSTALNVDVIPPVFINGEPTITNITINGFDVNSQTNEGANVYGVVILDGETPPTAQNVRDGLAPGASLQTTFTLGGNDFTDITGLASNTAYDVYVVAEDLAGAPNLQSNPTLLNVTTNAVAPPTSPGGVAANLGLWLKANQGVTGTSQVSQWDDQSGNLNDATQGTPASQPGLLDNAVNFNPAIDFRGDGSSTFEFFTAPFDINPGITDLTVFVVFDSDQSANTPVRKLYGHDAGVFNRTIGLDFRAPTNNFTYFKGPGDVGNEVGNYFNLAAGQFYLSTSEYTTSTFNGWIDGIQEVTLAPVDNGAGQSTLTIGAITASGSEPWDGRIAEMVMYAGTLTAFDRQKIESYLSVKYGITMAGGTQDYLASDGSIYWDAIVNSAYNNDITAIMRDDNSGLNQKQSTSINTASPVTIGLGTVASSNEVNGNVFSMDLMTFVIGDNGASADFPSLNLANVPAGIDGRLNRIWRAEESNGDVGNLEIQFDLAGLNAPSGSTASDYRLLVDGDGDFSTGAVSFGAASFVGDVVTFNSINISNGEHFTLGYVIPENAISLDGVSGTYAVSDANVSITGASARTLEFWYRHNVTNSGITHPVSYGVQSTGQAFGVFLSDADLHFYGELADYNTGYTFTDVDWHHIAITYDGAIVRTFVDGEPTPTTAQGIALNTGDSPLFIGAKMDLSANISGEIDEVRIWQGARSNTDISSFAASSALNGELDQVLVYSFNQGSGPVDDIEGGNNLTLNGGSTLVVSTAFDSDVIPPAFAAGSPFVSSILSDGASLNVNIHETGDVHYVVLNDGEIAPNVTEVLGGTGSGGTMAQAFGSITVTTPNLNTVGNVTGLNPASNYDVYLVTEDDAVPSNTQREVTLREFTTLGVPVIRLLQVSTVANTLDITNLGTASQDISTYQICLGPGAYEQISAYTPIIGDYDLGSGETVTIDVTSGSTVTDLPDANAGLALFANTNFGSSSPDDLLDYIQWGADNQDRVGQAVTAGRWDDVNNFVSGPAPYDFTGGAADVGSTFWSSTIPVVITSAQAGNWSDPATWTGSAVPTSMDDVDIQHAVVLDQIATVADLTLSTGSLDMGTGSFVLTVTGDYDKASGTGLTPGNGTLILNGTNQTYRHIGDVTYHNLRFVGGGVTSVDYSSGNILFIENLLEVGAGTDLSFTDTPELVLNGTSAFLSNGSISSGFKWSLISDGTSHNITGGDFNNVSWQTSSTLTLASDFTYSGDLTSFGGGATIDLAFFTMFLGTDFTLSTGDDITTGVGGLEAQNSTNFTANGQQMPRIIVNAGAGTFTINSDLTFANDQPLVVQAGTVQFASQLDFSGASGGLAITGGDFSPSGPATLTFQNGAAISISGGTLDLSGDPTPETGYAINVRGLTATDSYGITQSAGIINLSTVVVSELGGLGLTFGGGNLFMNDVTFTNGLGTQYLTFDTGLDGKTFSEIHFGSGPTSNVVFINDPTQTITFDQYSGALGGPDFDEPGINGAINWTNEVILNDALDFDGMDDRVSLGSTPNVKFSGAPFTLEAWINPTFMQGSVVSNYSFDGSDAYGYDFYVDAANRLGFRIGDGVGIPDVSFSNNSIILPDVWQHVAVSWDGTTVQFYVNGQPEGSETYSGGIIDGLSNTYIGSNANSPIDNFFDGQIDEVRIWNVARSSADINAVYQNELNGNETGLVAYHNFSADVGTISVIDASANTNNGTLVMMDVASDWVTSGPTIGAPLADVTAPVLTNLTFSSIEDTRVDVQFDTDESADLYYAFYTSAQSLTAENVINVDFSPVHSGSFLGELAGSKNFGIGDNPASLPELVANTQYFVYWVGEDAAGNRSTVLSGDFTTDPPPVNLNITNIPVAGTSLNAGSTNNLIYKLQMDVSGGTATMEGFYLVPNGTFVDTDISQWSFYENTIMDDFATATAIVPTGQNGFLTDPGDMFPFNDGDVGVFFGSAYTNETVYWYVAADISPSAQNNVTIGFDAPIVSNSNSNFGIVEENNQIGTPVASNTFTLTNSTTPPTISVLNLALDNSYVDVTWSEGVYNTAGGSGGLEASDFDLSLSGGTAANPVILTITQTDGISPLVGGESIVRLGLAVDGTPDGGETLTVNPVDGASIFNGAGLAAVSIQSNNSQFLRDQVVPEVTSITRQAPTNENTAATSVIFRVLFSEGVFQVDAADFELGAGGATGTISNVTQNNSSEYDVTVSSIAQAGTNVLDLNFTDDQDIQDLNGVSFAGTINAEETYSILSVPTTQATNIVVSNIEETSAEISWTNGNGAQRLVALFAGSDPFPTPVDGTNYIPSSNLTFPGDQAGTGWFVVYTSSGNAISVSGLTPGQQYTLAVAEFDGIGATSAYLTSTATNNPVTFTALSLGSHSLSFDGSDDYLSTSLAAPGGDFTLEAWTYTTDRDLNTNQTIVEFDNNSPGIGLESGRLAVFGILQDTEDFPENEWVHVAITYNSTSQLVTLYKNGFTVGAPTSAGPWAGTQMFVGGDPNTAEMFPGNIDEVRLWSGQRSQLAIQTNMDTEITGSTPGIQAYWDFDEGPGFGTAGDRTIGTNDLALNNIDINAAWVAGFVPTGAPTPVISSTATSPTNVNPIPITVQFDEIVTGFVIGDLVVSNGTLQNFVAVDGDTYTLEIVPIADGNITLDIPAAVSQDGQTNDNLAATQFTIDFDGTPPTVGVDALTTSDATPELTGTTNDNTATIAVTVNSANYNATNNGDGTWTLVDNTIAALTEGTYEVQATATDAAGNVGNDATGDELVIDFSSNTAPVVTVDDLTTSDASPVLTGSINDDQSPDLSTIVVNVNGEDYNGATIIGTTWTLADNTINALANGTYTVTATATDQALESASNTGTLTIQSVAVAFAGLTTTDLTPALSGTVGVTGAAISINANGADYAATNLGDGTWTLADNTIDSLDVGSYTVTVTATETSGNTGADTGTLVIGPSSVTASTAASLGTVSFVASWSRAFGGVSNYQLDVSTSLNFTSFVTGYESLAVTDTFQTVTGLDYTTNYYYRVRVLYNSGDVSENSNTVTVTTATDPGTAQDSTALVSIYNSTGGSSWTDNTNWLTGRLSTWQGVTMTEARITAVDLSSNNLTGAIGDITEGLDALTTLNLSGNQLTNIGALTSLTSLSSADVSSNDLEFGSLENVRNQTTNLTFLDQGIALEASDALVEIGQSFTIDRSISGSNNTYAWFRGNTSIDNTGGTLTVTPTSPDDEGIFRAEVTNSNFPGLTITTADFELKVSSIERDQQALLNIYNTLDAANTWTNGADWPNNGDITTWVGVVVDATLNRVTELDLSGSNVIGDMPDDLQDIGGLTRLDLSNNEIGRLPDISSLTLSQVNVSSNRLDFGDLEPNITILGGLENYDNQGLIGAEDREELVARGNDFTLSLTSGTGGTANTYSWTRLNALGSTSVGDGTNNVSIDNIRYENMGIFTVQVSNTIVPGLTLESHPINVFATARLDGNITDENGGPLPEGSVQALRIPFTGEDSRGYDSLDAIAVVNGSFTFGELVLGDLLLSTRVEDGTETYLPTYFGNTPFFTEASTIELREDFSITGYQMQLNPPGFEPGDGDGEVGLGVESDFAEDRQQAREAGRLSARRKLQKVGCSLRRRRRATGGRDEGIANDDEFELVVYKETDADGRVTFENLPPDTYRLNIEYPGIPMDPDSFIEFEVGEGGLENNTLQLEATVDENGIAVELVEELGFYRHYFKDLELYPNPVDRELTIRYSKLLSEHVRVQLLNLQGRLIKEERVGRGYNQEMVLDTQDVEEGIYLVRFIDPTRREGNNIVTYKIIVKRR